jgi:uncharacterized protein (DUF362 family)
MVTSFLCTLTAAKLGHLLGRHSRRKHCEGNLFPPAADDRSVPSVMVLRPGPGDVKRCLDFMNTSRRAKGRRVLIKPNLTVNMPAGTGVTTHPRLVFDAARYLINSGAREVVIGESSATRVAAAFEDLGFRRMADALGIRIVDFWDDECVRVEVPEPLAVEAFQIARTVLDSDLILNMPVLKIHQGESKVTLCAKNMMGCIAGEKSFMHADFNTKIIDLLKVVKPDLNIVDGIVAMEGHEIYGKAVGANVLVAGDDFVAVDSVCSRLMGFRYGEVEHIALAEKNGFGWADPSKITVQGLAIADVARRFARAGG